MAVLRTLLLLALLSGSASAAEVRLKEIADVQGIRDNDLFGYGLVIGLDGTGDSDRVLFTTQSMGGMLGRLGIRVSPSDIHVNNVAAVMVTARLPAFTRPGTRLDVTVSSIGTARSLAGGVLLETPLAGGDGQVYAVAQGPVQVGGFTASSIGSMVQKNQTTSGRVPLGASVELSVAPLLTHTLVLSLKQPDFTNVTRMAEAIRRTIPKATVRALDSAQVEVIATADTEPVALLAQLESVVIDADQRAKVVISERTGTIVAGERVRLRPVAIAHGGIRVTISNTPFASQPLGPAGRTVSGRQAVTTVEETSKPVVAVPATGTVDELVKALNLLGASPRDLVAILQAIRAAGALDGELEVL